MAALATLHPVELFGEELQALRQGLAGDVPKGIRKECFD
jgi:hypothetical protein